jgi:high frequency lysogenization protein
MTVSNKNLRNQVIALAGVAQAAALVDKLACSGTDDADAFNALVHGLLEANPSSTESVFISCEHLRPGLMTLRNILYHGVANSESVSRDNTNSNANYGEILRYALSMIHLERKLSSNKEMLASIGKRLEQTKRQVEHFHAPDSTSSYRNESVLANIASIYSDTISTFRFRIQVNGNPDFLQQELIVHKIRCLLLCGIRATVLWKQVGGSRLNILLNRKKYSQIATELLGLH